MKRLALFIVLSLSLALAQSAQAALIHHWVFNEGTGTAAAATVGGCTSSQAMTLAAGASWVAGNVGAWAIRFDGSSNGKANCSNGTGGLGTTHTVSYWLRYPAGVDAGVVATGYSSNGYISYLDATNWYYNVGGTSVLVAHGGFTSNVWYFMVIVRSGTSVSFYRAVLGAADITQIGTTQTLAANTAFADFNTFGGYPGAGGFETQIDLDDFRIYDTALSGVGGEASALYQSYGVRRQMAPIFFP